MGISYQAKRIGFIGDLWYKVFSADEEGYYARYHGRRRPADQHRGGL